MSPSTLVIFRKAVIFLLCKKREKLARGGVGGDGKWGLGGEEWRRGPKKLGRHKILGRNPQKEGFGAS